MQGPTVRSGQERKPGPKSKALVPGKTPKVLICRRGTTSSGAGYGAKWQRPLQAGKSLPVQEENRGKKRKLDSHGGTNASPRSNLSQPTPARSPDHCRRARKICNEDRGQAQNPKASLT